MTSDTPAVAESGVILINVLSVLALASAVMVAILTLQDVSIERSTRFMDAASANAYALGGEASAIVALRRDARDAPETDHLRESWAAIQETDAPVEGGAFTLRIQDEQGRYNLNNLLTDGLGAEDALRSLLKTLSAPPGLASAITSLVVGQGGLDSVDDLARAGVDPALLIRLSDVLCVLPESTDVNVNTASEPLLAALLGNRASAQLLIAKRDRQGFLTSADVTSARAILPARTGFRSDYYAITVTVTYGTVTQSLTSHLYRTKDDGQVRVGVWSRQRNTAARFTGPPL